MTPLPRPSPQGGREEPPFVSACDLPFTNARTIPTSSNGTTVPPIVWPCSWPLPATASTSPGPSASSPAAIARARSPISRAPGQAARMAARIDAGILAARVVVGDDRQVGEA